MMPDWKSVPPQGTLIVDRRRFLIATSASLVLPQISGIAPATIGEPTDALSFLTGRSSSDVSFALLEVLQRGVAPRSHWMIPAELKAVLPALLQLSGVPGGSVALVNGKQSRQHMGFGIASAITGLPMSADTITEAASLGKSLFAYMVLRLVQDGRLELDRPLSEYAEMSDVTDARGKMVTARHVLSHTTGFPNWRARPEPLIPTFLPGDRFRYSGEGYYYLQRVIERLTGRGVEELMRLLVFEPFGMTSSGYVWRAEFEKRMAEGHAAPGDVVDGHAALGRAFLRVVPQVGKPMVAWTADDAVQAQSFAFPKISPVTNRAHPNVASSLFTTAIDYGRFLSHLFARSGPGALDSELLKAMFTPQSVVGPTLNWGLGWGLERQRDVQLAWHWGDNGIFKNFSVLDPVNERGIAVFTNSSSGFKAYERIIRATTGREYAALLYYMVE